MKKLLKVLENKYVVLGMIFLPLFLAYLMWLFAYYPGIMSGDSVNALQAVGHDTNWQPYVHTLFMKIFYRAGGVQSISLFQILFVSTGLTLILYSLYRRGVNKILLGVLYLSLLFSIPIGMMNISLWRDVLFSTALVFLSYFVSVRISNKEWKFVDYAVYTILLIIVGYFRHNGIVFIVIFPVLIAIFQKYWKTLIRLGSISLGIFFLFGLILPRVLDVSPSAPSVLSMLWVYHSEANFYNRGLLSSEIRADMEKIFTKENLAKNSERRIDYLLTSGQFDENLRIYKSTGQEIQRSFFTHDLWVNLDYFLGDRVTIMTGSLLGIGSTVVHGGNTIPSTNTLGLHTVPVIPRLNRGAFRVLKGIDSLPIVKYIVWSNWWGLLVAGILFVLAISRKNISNFVFTFCILIQVPLLFLLNVADDWRYLYFLYLSAFICIALISLEFKKEIKKKKELKKKGRR